MKKTFAIVSLVALAGLSLGACSDSDDGGDDATNAATGSASGDASGGAATDFTACLVTDEGGFSDKGLNEEAYKAMERTGVELGITTKSLASNGADQYADNLTAMVNQGCGIIVTVGSKLAEATKASADANAAVKYAIVGYQYDAANQPVNGNIKPAAFATQEGAFLAGYLAAAYSTSGKVATFGGEQTAVVTLYMDGFADGVARYNADNGAAVELLGWDKTAQQGQFVNSFTDRATANTLALDLIGQGADVIMPVAGEAGLGAAAAAAEKDNVVIVWTGSDGYRTTDYGSVMLVSVLEQSGSAVSEVVSAASQGEFTSDPYIGTLANGGVELSAYHDFNDKITAETRNAVGALQTQVAGGEIKVESVSAP